ncbi:hypothetical protein [Brevundimonas sp. R86498]|uniref:hypothetical protein n=1 Tax=Brevundimonas sp. R86498 TaxID=3093845 RepID=UPI0037CBA4A6
MTATRTAKIRKALLAGGLGAISGAAGMTAFLTLGLDPVWADGVGGRVAAGGVGVVYLVTGLFILMGMALPSLGARILNVSDVEELLEQRAMLTGSAVTVLSFGTMLLCLACSGPGGFVPDPFVLGAIAGGLIVTTVVSVRQWPLYDELWRQLSWECSAFGLAVLLPVLILWGTAVQLGYAGAMDPLGVIALAAGSILVGAYIATGRRGLLALK